MTDTSSDKGAIVNTYTGNIRSAVWGIAIIIAIHILVLLLLPVEHNVAFWSVNIILFTLYAIFFGIMVFQATRISIIVYENGINWQRNSSHTFTTWDNIAKIDRRNEGDSTTYGIYLQQAIQPLVNSAIDKRFFSAPVDYISLIPTIIVPTKFKCLEGNVIDWKTFAETDFGQDISLYVPHLLRHDE